MAGRKETVCTKDLIDSLKEQGHWSELEIEPVVKQRPRVMKGGWSYTPKKTKDGETKLKELLAGFDKMQGAIHLEVIFVLRSPKNPKYDYPSRGDVDNYLKFFCDGANGILWDDDRHITKVTAEKIWGEYGRIMFKRTARGDTRKNG